MDMTNKISDRRVRAIKLAIGAVASDCDWDDDEGCFFGHHFMLEPGPGDGSVLLHNGYGSWKLGYGALARLARDNDLDATCTGELLR